MAALRVVVTIVFIVVSLALLIVVLMQEGKSAGLGAISGAAETYWVKAKGKSMEGMLQKVTKILATLFIVLAAILNIGKF